MHAGAQWTTTEAEALRRHATRCNEASSVIALKERTLVVGSGLTPSLELGALRRRYSSVPLRTRRGQAAKGHL
jgi:hypothetical protein